MAGGILPESSDQLCWSPDAPPISSAQQGYIYLLSIFYLSSAHTPLSSEEDAPLSSAHQALDEQLYGETLDHLQVPREGRPQGAEQGADPSQSPADQSITTL